jgi:hypothetical protein
MWGELLRLARTGIDSKFAHLRVQVEELRSRTIRQLTEQIKEAGLVVGFALAGTVAATATFVIALVALYQWVETHKGSYAALAAVGAVTGLLAAVMYVLAFARKRRNPVSTAAAARPIVKPSPPPSPSPPSSAAALSEALPRPPPNASLVEILTHRFSTRVAGVSDEVIDAAVHVVRTGSRSALLGILGAVVLVGVLIGRRQ